jgi:hypothetical protein
MFWHLCLPAQFGSINEIHRVEVAHIHNTQTTPQSYSGLDMQLSGRRMQSCAL